MDGTNLKVGDLVLPWPEFESDALALIVGVVSDQWSDRILVYSDDNLYEVPFYQIEVINEMGS